MITLYTTGCPRCKVLEKKLQEKKVEYTECNDVDHMLSLGIMQVPVLEVYGARLDYTKAIQWANAQ